MYLKVHPITIQWLQNNSSQLHNTKTQLWKAKIISVLKKWDKAMYGLTGTQRWPQKVFTLTSHIYIPNHPLSSTGMCNWVSNLLRDSTCQKGQCCTFIVMKLQTTYYISSFSELANSIKSWFILFSLIISHIPYSTSTDN